MAQTTLPVTILIADDDPDDQMLTRDALLENRLYNDLHFVSDGQELMDYLLHRGVYTAPETSPRPDLILLDLNMPRKDGREALREIKENTELRTIPIVILTTSKAEEDILRTYNLGVNSFIVKPVTFQALVDIIRVVTEYWFTIVRLPPNYPTRWQFSEERVVPHERAAPIGVFYDPD
ncbi:MAG: response regulator [Caldilinea sp.]|uniref:response regulator n=1 Tax=Caldilinea sp. TaxID=2293560 RepID=UPI002D055D72|nr:response regulator [Anaerolineales bacterium]HQY91867.1 response regulator [Caldilinea sp.]HRA68194.1 response regulator [Caldilinea sp.]